MKIRKPADVKKPNLTVHPVLLEVWLFSQAMQTYIHLRTYWETSNPVIIMLP